ncbi:GPCR fungal pheromone mating factor [Suillus plorans]|uniref:GPCR fungal pheromone mating factor n=1 Tax=Suillus plorans TaxID=116603 RepID=A0A9P7APL6_9AGAM|nr:GPCR fungal pheromone mating factor [Suillus plorans]KAG1793536.1 GPCR fungal pheromone mating factor [Suillus plorans]
MIWAALSCLNQFINSIVWHNNAINWAPIWCDISIRIMLGAPVGIPAASLCINRRLYNIAKTHAVAFTDEAKRRAILIDTLICVLFPMIVVALPFFLSDSWPIIIGLVSSVYCGTPLLGGLLLFTFAVHNSPVFLKSNKSLSASRYFRLMALAMTEILCTIPLASFIIWLNSAVHPVEPWISWENVHCDFSRVMQYPSVLWTTNYLLVVAIQLTRWLIVFCAFTFFAFFGFAAEARKNYSIAFCKAATAYELE